MIQYTVETKVWLSLSGERLCEFGWVLNIITPAFTHIPVHWSSLTLLCWIDGAMLPSRSQQQRSHKVNGEKCAILALASELRTRPGAHHATFCSPVWAKMSLLLLLQLRLDHSGSWLWLNRFRAASSRTVTAGLKPEMGIRCLENKSSNLSVVCFAIWKIPFNGRKGTQNIC